MRLYLKLLLVLPCLQLAFSQELRIGIAWPSLSDAAGTLDPAVMATMKQNKFTHVNIPYDYWTMFYNWRMAGNASVSPWSVTSAPKGLLTTNGRSFLVNLLAGLIRQASANGLKVIPQIPLGAHGTGFGMASDVLQWNRRHFISSDPSRPIIPKPLLKDGGGWQGLVDEDIGTPALAGSAIMNRWLPDPAITVNAGGTDIWGTSDQFHFVYNQMIVDNSSVMANVNSITNTNSDAKAGVMLRASLAPNSPYVYVLRKPGSISMHVRTASGGSASQVGATITMTTPIFLRITRDANLVITGQYSTDATNWTTIGSLTISSIPKYAFAGIAVTSHNTTARTSAIFTSVAITNSAMSYASTPNAPDANFDPLLVDLLNAWQAGLNLARTNGWTSQTAFDFVHFQHDEDVTGGNLQDPSASPDYLLIGEGGVDKQWFNARLATQDMQSLVPELMALELKQRCNQAHTALGASCKVIIYGDMWDFYHTGGQPIKNYLTTQTVKTAQVLDNSTAKSFQNDYIISPWQYDSFRYYQPASNGPYDFMAAINQYSSRGYQFAPAVALSEGAPHCYNALTRFVAASGQPKNIGKYRGFSSHTFTTVDQIEARKVYTFSAQLFTFFASFNN